MIWLWIAGFVLCVAFAVAYEWQPRGRVFSVASTIFLMLMIYEVPHIGPTFAAILGTCHLFMMFQVFVADPKSEYEEL